MGAGFAGGYQCFEHLCRILPEGGGDFGAGNGSGGGIAIGLVGNFVFVENTHGVGFDI